MESILDRLRMGIVLLAEDGSVRYANKFCKELKLISQDCEGRKYYEAFRNLELIGFVGELLEGKSKSLEFWHQGRFYRASSFGEGAIQIDDMTELWKFKRLQREFAAAVSHELSTPLTAIKGLLETALIKETPDVKLLGRALKRVEDLEKLIKSLRTLTLLDSGEKPLKGTFSLKELVERILEDFKEEITQKELKVRLIGDDTEVKSDKEKLYILLKNLVENAIKYNEAGGSITIRLSRDNRRTKVAIEDTGKGIPKEDLPLIFQPFFGGKNKKGMGLGLAISKKIADFLSAELRIRSEEGKGTTAEILLP